METTDNLTFNVLEYSTSPGPRYCTQGDDSGEDFYYTKLNGLFNEAYSKQCKLIINLDGVDGYASSFLDESFGNLVYDFSEEIVKHIIRILSDEEPMWIDMINKKTIPEWEKRRLDKQAPTTTTEHQGKYCMKGNKVIWEPQK